MKESIKLCHWCHKPRPVSEFHKNKRNKDGLNYFCKRCKHRYDVEYIKRPGVKEKRNAYKRTPQYRAWKREYMRKYRTVPEHKQKQEEILMRYYVRKAERLGKITLLIMQL